MLDGVEDAMETAFSAIVRMTRSTEAKIEMDGWDESDLEMEELIHRYKH